jgi:hypothetical protein
MSTKKKMPFLSGIPSWALAALSFIASLILFFILGDIGGLMNINAKIGEPILFIIYGIFIAVCCFFIVRQNPISIWYVPVISNALGIFIAIASSKFWMTSEWIYFCIGWVLSIIVSIIGYRIGIRSGIGDVNVPK